MAWFQCPIELIPWSMSVTLCCCRKPGFLACFKMNALLQPPYPQCLLTPHHIETILEKMKHWGFPPSFIWILVSWVECTLLRKNRASFLVLLSLKKGVSSESKVIKCYHIFITSLFFHVKKDVMYIHIYLNQCMSMHFKKVIIFTYLWWPGSGEWGWFAKCPQKPADGIRSLEAGVKDLCTAHQGAGIGTLEKQ